MRRMVAGICCFGVLVIGQEAAWSAIPDKPADAPKPGPMSWAHWELKGAYPEGPQMPGLFGDAIETLSDALGRFERAAQDDSISGIVLRINNPQLGWAKLNDFRQAIERVRGNGKKVYAWIDSGSSLDYLLATACDEIVMPESGGLMLIGLRAEVSFYKNLFDKLDVKPDMLRVGEFKSAAEPYTRTEMSPEFRQEMETILDDYYRQIVETIADGRKLDQEAVSEAIDSGPHTAKAARELGLIDRIAYENELEEIVANANSGREIKLVKEYGKKKIDTDFSGMAGMIKLINLMMGVENQQRRSTRSKIAVIHANGIIMTGRSQSGLFGGQTLGSETLIKAIQKAADDSNVKAIVLRVDSPGGSALASDLIWNALQQVEQPVVVSMGDVAASGGYYISMGADRIFAEPGTLTGSIGVVGGKLALKGLFDKIGINTSVISRGKNSGIMSTLEGFSESERETMQKMLKDIYEQFTTKAAEGRGMEPAELEKLARGRVYTGAMAVENGLVDELGTLEDAIAHARTLAGLEEDEKVERMHLPRPTSPFEQLFGPIDSTVRHRSQRAANELPALLNAVSPELTEHLERLEAVNLLSHELRLTVLPFRLSVK